MFRIPVKENNTDIHSLIHPHSGRPHLIRSAAVIIWDGLTLHSCMETIHEVCSELKHLPAPSRGIPFLGLGDFHQVAPVVKGIGCTVSAQASIKQSPLWRQFQILSLTAPVRSVAHPQFTEFVDLIRENYQATILDRLPGSSVRP